MSVLSRLSRKAVEQAQVAELPRDCGPWELAPRWDAAADIGVPNLVVSYACASCRSIFLPEEVKAMRDS